MQLHVDPHVLLVKPALCLCSHRNMAVFSAHVVAYVPVMKIIFEAT